MAEPTLNADESPMRISERITLEKFDGDPPGPGETKEPVETIIIEDGEILSHTKKED